MRRRILWGILLGAIFGFIDLVPMIIQNLTWDANLGAFLMWVIVGFLIATSELKIHPVLKGLLYSFLSLIPSAFLIGWHKPTSLIPIAIVTIVLGSLLGFTLGKIYEKLKLTKD